jgi:hypothetical protein
MLYMGKQKGISTRLDQSARWGLIGVLMLLGVASGRGGDLGTGIAVLEALILDQSFTTPTDLGAAINDCCRFVAQTFTAGLTGTLGGVNIDVLSGSKFPLHVAIRAVINGVPTTTVLGETTFSSGSAPLSQLITFPQVIHITAGVQYAIVVNYEGAPPPSPDNFQGEWQGATGDEYPGGALYFSFLDGISWVILTPGADVHFQTYVNVESCTLNVEASSPDGSLNLAFEVGTREPATWNAWLTSQDEIARLFSVPLPVIEPPIPVSLTLPFFSNLGTIGVLATLTTPDKGIICSAFVTVDTRSSGLAAAPSPQALQDFLGPSVRGLHDQLRQLHIR